MYTRGNVLSELQPLAFRVVFEKRSHTVRDERFLLGMCSKRSFILGTWLEEQDPE